MREPQALMEANHKKVGQVSQTVPPIMNYDIQLSNLTTVETPPTWKGCFYLSYMTFLVQIRTRSKFPLILSNYIPLTYKRKCVIIAI
jgi:hypothetical protein